MAFELIPSNIWNNALTLYGFDESIEIESLKDLKPTRATKKSAGYDFKMPFDLVCKPGVTYKIPTGYCWLPHGAYIKTSVDHPEENDTMKKLFANDKDPFDNTIFVPNVLLNIEYPVLMLYPRSSLAIYYGFRLINTTGVIDADYYNNPSNGGHIIVAFTVEKEVELTRGSKFCQGVILPFVFDSEDTGTGIVRQGGIGSTDK